MRASDPSAASTFALKPGMRVALKGRVWVVQALSATDVVLKRTDQALVSGDEVSQLVVPVREFVENLEATEALVLDIAGVARLKARDWKDQVRWSARVKVVNLHDTGYTSGHPALEEAPTVPSLAVPNLSGNERRRILLEFLETNDPVAREICFDLNAQHRRDSGSGAHLRFKPPGNVTIWRWVTDFNQGNVWGVIDERSGPRAGKGRDAARRAETERLVDEVLDRRTSMTSQRNDTWVINQVLALADEQQLDILGKTKLRDIVRTKHGRAGRTPSQAETARQDGKRTGRHVVRPMLPGFELAWDSTVGDVMVTLVPGGKPFRAHVHICVDAATGVVVSAFATGRYSAANVLLLAYDAFRPMTVMPLHDGGIVGRAKTRPHRIFISDTIKDAFFKPGAIPRRVRSDNAKQNFAYPTMAVMRYYGIDLCPSQVGVKTQNTHAENAIGIASNLLQEFPAYLGRSTTARGRHAERAEEPWLLERLNAELQQVLVVEHNSARCTAPAFRNTGVSRVEAWDELVDMYGQLPDVTRSEEYFQFLPSKRVQVGKHGISLERERFDNGRLQHLPPHVKDELGRVEVRFDPRRLEHIWVSDPLEGRYYQVRNVLTEYMDGPLVAQVRREALRRSGLPNTANAYRRSAFAHYAEEVLAETGHHVGIDRDLADWSLSGFVYQQSQRQAPTGLVEWSDLDGADVAKSKMQDRLSIDLDRPLATPGLRS